MKKMLLLCGLICTFATGPANALDVPDEAINYQKMAFYPARWTQQEVSGELYPWKGTEVVLLTTEKELAADTMKVFLGHLDRGWAYYHKITGRTPRPYKTHEGKPTIAAVPNASLTCGLGCGMVGATGIEVGKFPSDWKEVRQNAQAMPHYYFYEMGRNYYVFGRKHDCFVTGYAVFMRYCCMDELKLIDNDVRTRQAIENAIDAYAESDLDFITAMTHSGSLSEKQQRIRSYRGPCDQPVMYASAMLRLRRDYGGDEFVQRFYHALHEMPAYGENERGQKPDNAKRQSVIWLLTACRAAKQDLSPMYVDQWRLPLSDEARELIQQTDWADESGDDPDFARRVLTATGL
ncbi:MAG: calcium-binding protein [Rhodopirellula sp. JB053]